MKFNKFIFCLLLALLFIGIAQAAMVDKPSGAKKLDIDHYHNVGNMWLRVSNYGFFGSGDDAVPQYPSLEYPGGQGIDYLYQGALWFGAKKYRRDSAGRKLYWRALNPSADSSQTVPYGSPDWQPWMKPVMDTLVSVGFDGDWDIYEFLPAYNPLVSANTNPEVTAMFGIYNGLDRMITSSTRTQKRGVDDDGDGCIDEDFVGYTFPLRRADELPIQFQPFGGQFIADTNNYNIINTGNNMEIWFPLGFMDLSDTSFRSYCFSMPYDDDNDGQIDEDGAPVSEQDFIGYYYDYCPFGTPGDRDYGGSRGSSKHFPLNVRVRQMSYQWSYEYIKNLVYVEFDITNMNTVYMDTLFDCAMGIYMDCDCGPQVWGREKAEDDVSGYVKGSGYEFAYTRDADGDGGLTTGYVGARVCTPDPEQLQFHCWYWKVGNGPKDTDPLNLNYAPKKTANEKYWLLTGRNPDETKFDPLRPEQIDQMEFEETVPKDTRFLFAFYGDQNGVTAPTENSWNLAPGRTMKIVVAVFPGDNLEDLKSTATFAKMIYGQAQTLNTVVLPDTFPHYSPPEPPDIPKLFAEMTDDGSRIELYWDNRSEFSYDVMTVSSSVIGWQDPNSPFLIPGIDSDPNSVDWSNFPDEFKPNPNNYNMNARVNPFTGYRLRHDFQGYTTWGRSGSGSQEDWVMQERWDKIDTPQDLLDYNVNIGTEYYINYGGYLGIDKGLPNKNQWTGDITKFYRYDETYQFVPYENGDDFYGWPIYNPEVEWSLELQQQAAQIEVDYADLPPSIVKNLKARLFKHPEIRDDIFDAIYDPKMIPLPGFGGQVYIPTNPNDQSQWEKLTELKKQRLARRYYHSAILYPPKGIEYYIAVTTFDRGIPLNHISSLESGRDKDANMKVFFPGTVAKSDMNNIYVVPNPYIGKSKFDGRREKDEKGDKSRRIWFVNLPERCKIKIYTLAGDLVDEIDHDGSYQADILTVSKATTHGLTASGMHDWDLLSKHNQIIAPGVYLYSVENKADNKIKVGKFVIIK
ncbi:MAG TPA: hypothetical protein PK187_01610 [Candidatus Syntrophosphaera thermopropionivorans]|jgi:hypothetical protein|nr:hypothetical protein [Candidatus Syntrophosphaera thermopropionivorans]HOL33166.1 hypothetical protein [Candidatus Syntrophosphaera thermopropionivorans]HPQ30304.1 hypothetical protein [Candidatus Syntrophosphaera thermopropionivorans]HPX62838.1 hypothetical protein [Candidatus Syntrophosphaera thermopropionivorans]HQC58007.1 hypothetical protein [Candidatus Syntrophosphaera thermopropionivorans]